MKQIIFTILLITSCNLYAQTDDWRQINQKLDTKNGFKDFKLGKSVSNYIHEIKLYKDNGQITIYIYTGTKHNSLFSYQFDRVLLHFLNGELYKISVDFKAEMLRYVSISIDLEKVFGKPFDANTSLTGEPSKYSQYYYSNMDQAVSWRGKFVEMKHEYRASHIPEKCLSRLIIENIKLREEVKKLRKKTLEDDF